MVTPKETLPPILCMPDHKATFKSVAFVASDTPEAVSARARLVARYGAADPKSADAIVALGGDGLMLQTLYQFMDDGVPIYGMNRGSVGFLMNEYCEDDLLGRLQRAEINRIHPLRMRARDVDGQRVPARRSDPKAAASPRVVARKADRAFRPSVQTGHRRHT